MQALKEVLTLNVVQDVDSDDVESLRVNTRRYKYDQLLDLQSRLMLVAGKAEQGKDEVDRFMLVRISSTYSCVNCINDKYFITI